MVSPDRSLLAEVGAALGSLAERDRPLGPLTTYRVGGPASLFVQADSTKELLAVRRALAGRPIPVLIVGRGSNLLVADAGFRGLALRLGRDFEEAVIPGQPAHPISNLPSHVVRAGAAMDLPVLARRTVDVGLGGLEWAVGVPGSVGGGVYMNAGGHGSDIAACLVRYQWLDLCTEAGGDDEAARLAFSYRSSSLRPGEVVLSADFALSPADPDVGREALREIVRWRRANQPGGSNAGSIFTNPAEESAGHLVEAAGLKGFRLGSAQVSEKHANFIQADEGGSADDVARLIVYVRDEVAARLGFTLAPEVRLIGFAGGETGGEARRGERR